MHGTAHCHTRLLCIRLDLPPFVTRLHGPVRAADGAQESSRGPKSVSCPDTSWAWGEKAETGRGDVVPECDFYQLNGSGYQHRASAEVETRRSIELLIPNSCLLLLTHTSTSDRWKVTHRSRPDWGYYSSTSQSQGRGSFWTPLLHVAPCCSANESWDDAT